MTRKLWGLGNGWHWRKSFVTFVFLEMAVCREPQTMMSISELSQRSLEKLYRSLEEVPTLNWKVLMTKRFASLHSEDDVAIIESSSCPAKALLDDLTYREIPLRVLVDGLEAIGNKRAASIVKKGCSHFFFSKIPFFFNMYWYILY